MADLYDEVSINGYNANPPDDDGSETEANRVKWATIKDKITDPVKTALDAMNGNVKAFSERIDGGVTSYASSTQVQESDQGKLVRATQAGSTITSPDATDVGAPFVFDFRNASNGDVFFAGHSTQTVDGIDTSTTPITVPAGMGFRVRTNGANWETSGLNFPTPVVYPPASLFTGLEIKVTGNTGLTVVAKSIVVSNGTKSQVLTSVSHTINMATTGANALDTGSIAQATWYAIWEIAKEDGTKAALASTSFTSPTLPTDYVYAARIGAVRTAAGAAQLMGTWQLGRRAQYKVGLAQTAAMPIADSGTKGSVSTPTWQSVALGSFVPPTASVVNGAITSAGSGISLMVAPNNSYGAQSSTTNAPPVSIGNTAGIGVSSPFSFLLESTNIYWASNGNGFVYVQGWEDNI